MDTNWPGLKIYLLGPPNVTYAGEKIILPRRQVRALLYYLAVRLEPAARDELCLRFWPDSPDVVARRRLTLLLAHLRRVLPDPELLWVSEGQAGLDPRRAWSDTVHFNGLVAQEDLNRAVGLVRGPFLSGFSLPDCPEYETWLAQEQRAWERLYLEKLRLLIDVHRRSGDVLAAIACARRYLDQDELAEEVHRVLIGLYAAAGDRGAGLEQYRRCVEILQRELGVRPLPGTEAMVQGLLRGQSNLPEPPDPNQVTPVLRPETPVDMLVGRDDILAQIEVAYTSATSGHGRIVLIYGEPGIGKSSLIREFARLQQGTALVLTGSCIPDGQSIPYQSLAEALQPAIPQLVCGTIQKDYLAEAARLLPRLRTLRPDLPAVLPFEHEEARIRLFEALTQIVLNLDKPVLLCLDDLQWADETTLNWLAYLGSRLASTVAKVLVIGACRQDCITRLVKLRQTQTRLNLLIEITLTGLQVGAIEILLRRLLPGQTIASNLPEQLHCASGGNPFYICETVQSFLEVGGLLAEKSDLGSLPLPDSIRSAVRQRLSNLNPEARQILEATSVLEKASFDVLQRVSGRDEMEALNHLDDLMRRQILDEKRGIYSFHHEYLRRAVLEDLSYARLRLLHRRAGRAVEIYCPQEVSRLAWHFEQGDEPGKAAKYALQVGDEATRVFAYREAQVSFDRALRLLEMEAVALRRPKAVGANRRQQVQALSGRGWVFRLLGEMQAYLDDLQKETLLAVLLKDPQVLAHVRMHEAAAQRWFCRYAEARHAAEEALDWSCKVHNGWLEGRARRELGLIFRETGMFHPSEAMLRDALRLFEKHGDALYQVHVLGNLSTLALYQGEAEQGLCLAVEALRLCGDAGLILDRRIPLGDMGAAALALGQFDDAARYLGESLEIARQVADRTQEIFCLEKLGELALVQPPADKALAYFNAALALAERLDSRTEQSRLHIGLAQAYRQVGDHRQACNQAAQAIALAQQYGRAHDLLLARIAAAE